MAYIGTQPKDVRSFGKAKFDYTSTQGQTAFTGADDDNKTLGFTDGQIEVFVNGILMDESDFTTSNGNTVTLASAANLNDVISIVAMQTDIPNSDYVPISGGTFTGAVTVNGAFTSIGIDDNADANSITIDTSENVLINAADTDPQNLSASSNTGVAIRSDGRLHAGAWQQRAAAFGRGGTDGEIVTFRKDGATVGGVNAHGGSLVVGGGDVGMGFYQSANALVPYDQSTNSVRDNAIDLGYPSTYRWKDLYLGGGVYLGGTGAANKLDDYETGTFSTALLQCTTSTPNYSINANRNKYVKIGKLVLAHFDFSFISLSGGAGDVLLNLPFTVNGTENYHSVHAQRNCSAFSGSIADYKINGYGGANSTLIYLLYSTGNSGAESAINASSLQNGRINLNFIYTTSD